MRALGYKSTVAIAVLLASLLAGAATADNLDRRMRINNFTGYTMMRFYASNRDARTWQEDMLGNSVIESGSSWIMDFNDGTGYCIFDFRAEFDGGQVLEKAGINVCKESEFTYQ